jgi:hypothetical protein
MKVERARPEGSDTNRSETKAANAQLQTGLSTSTAKTAELPNQGAFSKFMDAARQTSESGRTEKQTGDTEGDTSVDKPGDGKKDAVEAKGANRDDQKHSSGENDGDADPTWVPAPILASDKTGETNTSIPQARAILHVADLERIVSAVRSDAFAGSKQVTIDLKNSVLDGLRVQLTLTEQGNLKAEFLALNEQIKKQLDARKNELESVLRDRSIKCREINIRVIVPDEESVLKANGYDDPDLSIA